MLRIALCQANLPVGDIDGNVERMRKQVATARAEGADLIVFPELSITGYPPEDLLLRPSFSERAQARSKKVQQQLLEIRAFKAADDYRIEVLKQIDELIRSADTSFTVKVFEGLAGPARIQPE